MRLTMIKTTIPISNQIILPPNPFDHPAHHTQQYKLLSHPQSYRLPEQCQSDMSLLYNSEEERVDGSNDQLILYHKDCRDED
jgi:hypothetical protein